MNSDSLNMVSRLGEGHMPCTFFLSELQLKTTVLGGNRFEPPCMYYTIEIPFLHISYINSKLGKNEEIQTNCSFSNVQSFFYEIS